MKKKGIIALVIILLVVFLSLNFIYLKDDELNHFPIPLRAELFQKDEEMKAYKWSRASEENGIPFDYEIILKINGWNKEEREGVCVKFTKHNQTNELCSFHKEFAVIKR